MKFFLDCCVLEDIRKALKTGLVEGLTTNPLLLSKSPDFSLSLLKDIISEVKGPLSLQVLSDAADDMVAQGKKLHALSDYVVVKIPFGVEGLKATRLLASENIPVNMTLCFSALSALLAAKAGARYVSPFMGRFEDAGGDGARLIEDIRLIYDMHGCETEIMAASIRSPLHIEQAALAGAEIATLPFKIFWEMFENELTAKGLSDVKPHYNALQKKLFT